LNASPPSAGSTTADADQAAIDALVAAMFDLFTNADGRQPRVAAARELFLPNSTIIKNGPAGPEVFSLERFIETRTTILSDGSLTGFREQELQASTEIEGDNAERVCTYSKSGVLNGSPFTTRGVKVMRLNRTPAGWRLAALAWDDEQAPSTPPA